MSEKREYLDDCPDCQHEREEKRKFAKLTAERDAARAEVATLRAALVEVTRYFETCCILAGTDETHPALLMAKAALAQTGGQK